MSTLAADLGTRQQREFREQAVAEKKSWDPQVGSFLASGAVGSALSYGTVVVVGLAVASTSAIATAGWIVLAVIAGINAVGCIVVALSSVLNFR